MKKNVLRLSVGIVCLGVVLVGLRLQSCSNIAGMGGMNIPAGYGRVLIASNQRAITDAEIANMELRYKFNDVDVTSGYMDFSVGTSVTIEVNGYVNGAHRMHHVEPPIVVHAGNNVISIALSKSRDEVPQVAIDVNYGEDEPETEVEEKPVVQPTIPEEPEEPQYKEEPIVEDDDEKLLGDVIYIHTAEEFREYAEQMRNSAEAAAASYKLMADLDLSGMKFSSMATFSGDFDGNGHKIKNFTSSNDPLFHDVEARGIIRNLILENVSIRTGYYGQASPFALTMKGKLIGCQISGTISGSTRVYGLAEGEYGNKAVVVGCLSSIEPSSVNGGLCGSNAEKHGAAFAVDSDADRKNQEIREWNKSQTDERLRCDWHFEANGSKLTLVHGEP